MPLEYDILVLDDPRAPSSAGYFPDTAPKFAVKSKKFPVLFLGNSLHSSQKLARYLTTSPAMAFE
jgi:hypothetical protein